MQRQRSKPHTLTDNLKRHRERLAEEITALEPGSAYALIKRKIEQVDEAIRMDGWLRSGLSAPT